MADFKLPPSGAKGEFARQALAAQKSAARVIGAADQLLMATRAVLTERERELLELKGPCSNNACRLHFAHAGPCDQRESRDAS